MMYLGIDPGITGAAALYSSTEDRIIHVWDMPTQERVYGKGNEINWTKLIRLLEDEFEYLTGEGTFSDVVAVIEAVGVMPRQGIVSAFAFGQVMGGIRCLCSALELETMYIHPTAWKRQFALIGTKKEAVGDILRATYPEASKWLTLKKHHNRADAMAIAIAGSGVHQKQVP